MDSTRNRSSTVLGVGTVVADRFRLVRPIGQGGMGAVWVAEHVELETPCALKFIQGDAARSADVVARFKREAKAAAQLRSPHVVQILDYGVWGEVPYIAMELLEGEDLAARLQRYSPHPLPPASVIAIASDVGRALAKAHAAGLVHRDLKPANIFLVRDDDREIVKILDFGIAKRQTGDLADATTASGAVLGTPFYMSPEQLRRANTVDHMGDLWSLAVVIYQCATGALPFQADDLAALVVKVLVDPPPVPSRAVAGLGARFDAWWARAADRDVTRRFQSAKELVDALAEALSPGEVLAVREAAGRSVDLDAPVASVGDATGGAVSLPSTPTGSARGSSSDAGPVVSAGSARGWPGGLPPHHARNGTVRMNVGVASAPPSPFRENDSALLHTAKPTVSSNMPDAAAPGGRGREKAVAIVTAAVLLGAGAFQLLRPARAPNAQAEGVTVSAAPAAQEQPPQPRASAEPSADAPPAPASEPVIDPAGPSASATERPPTTAGLRPFDRAAALSTLSAAANAARSCKAASGPTGTTRVRVTFAPSGLVISATIDSPPFAGTPVARCVLAAVKRAHVPPFEGSAVVVTKSVSVN